MTTMLRVFWLHICLICVLVWLTIVEILVIRVASCGGMEESICILQSPYAGFVPRIIRPTGCTHNTLMCLFVHGALRAPAKCLKFITISRPFCVEPARGNLVCKAHT